MSTFASTNLKYKRRFVLLRGIPRLAARLKITLMLVLMLMGVGCTGETERKQVDVLRKMAADTPVFPGFNKTSEQFVLKPGMVSYYNNYASNSGFSDVKAFYDKVLMERNWGPPQQITPSFFVSTANLVSYRRGDYVIVVGQDDTGKLNFNVVFGWDPE